MAASLISSKSLDSAGADGATGAGGAVAVPVSSRTTGSAFDLLHPAVALIYFAVLLVLAMTAMHPVYLALALAGSFACRASMEGLRDALRTLRWQIPVILVIAVVNCTFVSSGTTELFRIGNRAFYAEALFYGFCSGMMLSCVLLIFANVSRVLTSDKVLAVLGRAVPTIALMVTMAMRLVPQFARRGKEIAAASQACTAAAGAPGMGGEGAGEDGRGGGDRRDRNGKRLSQGQRRQRVGESLRLVTVLMGWGMEDALETSDAMRARGWGAAEKRTSYQRSRFRATDGAACAVIAVLAVSSAAAAWTACSQLSFYPRVSGIAPWWSYAPFALFVFLPSILELFVREEDR